MKQLGTISHWRQTKLRFHNRWHFSLHGTGCWYKRPLTLAENTVPKYKPGDLFLKQHYFGSNIVTNPALSVGTTRGSACFRRPDFCSVLVDKRTLGPEHPCADAASPNSTRAFTWESEPPPKPCPGQNNLTFSPDRILGVPAVSHSYPRRDGGRRVPYFIAPPDKPAP